MKDVQEYDGYKYTEGSVAKVTDPLTVETPLQITINGEAFTVAMHTPGYEKELATGLLYAENVILDFSKIEWGEELDKYGRIENIKLTTPADNLGDGFLNSRSLLSVSSCGICGVKEIQDLLPNEEALKQSVSVSFNLLFQLFDKMADQQKNYNLTGGCHGIAAFNANGELLCIREDIGRHNALDKVVGTLLRENRLHEAKIVTFSGRTSYEMVAKAFRAKIPIIAAVSAPSSLAIDFAKEYGMTLIGFCRENSGTCYAGSNRILK